MQWGIADLRASFLRASALVAAAVMAAPASTSTPPLLWTDADRLGILCLVHSDSGVDAALGAALCERVRHMAAENAPVPASVLAIGDPAVLAQDTVTVLVHGTIAHSDGRRLLAFTMRPYRASADQAGLLFGAAPRVAALAPSGVGGADLDAALEAALSDILPWRTPPQSRPLSVKRQ